MPGGSGLPRQETQLATCCPPSGGFGGDEPENIMLSGRHALVADFGVAKAVSEPTGRQTLTAKFRERSGKTSGTPQRGLHELKPLRVPHGPPPGPPAFVVGPPCACHRSSPVARSL